MWGLEKKSQLNSFGGAAGKRDYKIFDVIIQLKYKYFVLLKRKQYNNATHMIDNARFPLVNMSRESMR